MNKQIYMIFYDRGYRAQDNGEHFCRWVMKNHPEVKTGYILNSNSYDWPRLQKEGFNLINGLDRINTHKELLACDFTCSSIFNEGINLDFADCDCKRVFLNHGCFLVPIKYIKDEHDNIDLFIAGNKVEYDNLLHPYHELSKQQVVLCGQPRHDALISQQLAPHTEDSILIQFWQRPGAWTEHNDKQFLASDFYKATTKLLSNYRLLTTCRKHKTKIIFKMHPIQYDWIKYYKRYENNITRISYISEPFEPEFLRSKLIITDISSNAYEMAKIGKPCVYFEPDPDLLFNWRLKKNGGFEFDLEHKSIGPVIYKSVDMLVEEICKLIENNYNLEKGYQDRRQEQISFMNDTNNCKRCFEAIMNLNSTTNVSKATQKKINKNKKQTKAYGKADCYLYF